MITPHEAREMFRYNPETGRLEWAQKIARKVVVGREAGTICSYGYRQVRIRGTFYKAHRIIWAITHGDWPVDGIDHINGIRDDNRLCNLREATQAENLQNLATRSDNTTGVTGVMCQPRTGHYEAYIHAAGKRKYLGTFHTIEAAAAAYAAAKAELHTFQPVARAA